MNVNHELLLEAGGGILDEASLVPADRGEACVAVGLGGVGIKALKTLKEKVYRTFKPDSTDRSRLSYGRIRFIGIDSDACDAENGRGALGREEFLNMRDVAFSNLLYAPMGREMLSKDPRYSWMDVDLFDRFPYWEGTGGVRQLGRALFISHAEEVRNCIKKALLEAMRAGGTSSASVFIFTGLSGGTGGGAFLDLCYVVQQIFNDLGWTSMGRIKGFFFLPDTVDAIPGLPLNAKARNAARSNGYAALMELDRLMQPDRNPNNPFRQNYGSFVIESREPPVDTCYLVSAAQSDGALKPDGLSRCIHAVTDFVMMNLIDRNMAGEAANLMNQKSGNWAYRWFLENKNTPLQQQEKGCVYLAVGAASAEIPRREMASYLASGFMERFQKQVGPGVIEEAVIRQDVDDFAKAVGLKTQTIMGEVTKNTVRPLLPDVDRSLLRSYGPMQKGQVPECWMPYGRRYLDESDGRIIDNCAALRAGVGRDITAYASRSVDGRSYGARIFERLCDVSGDPEKGPYYVVRVLFNGGYDLPRCVENLIAEMKGSLESLNRDLNADVSGPLADEMAEASADFANASLLFMRFGNKYERYKGAVERWFQAMYHRQALTYAIELMQDVGRDLVNFFYTYFMPLTKMLDALGATANANRAFLDQLRHRQSEALPLQIIELDDVREDLDRAVSRLEPGELVTDFMERARRDCEAWLNSDRDRTAAFFSRYMAETFREALDMDMGACLRKRFSAAGGAGDLVAAIEGDVIRPLDRKAYTMFFSTHPKTGDYEDVIFIQAPAGFEPLSLAIEKYKHSASNRVIVRENRLQDRIYIARLIGGIPPNAYGNLFELKREYGNSRDELVKAGLHLFPDEERTAGRSDDEED